MPSADSVRCDSNVSIIFLTLIFIKSIYNQIQKRKEITMKRNNKNIKTLDHFIHSFLETIWAIGTSITAAVVLIQKTTFTFSTCITNNLS